MIKDKRRGCGREECPECPPGSASNISVITRGCNPPNNQQTLINWCSAWSNEDLRRMQQEDPDINKVYTWLNDNPEVPNKATQAPESDGVRAICAQWPQLTILEGLLYRKWHLKHDQTEEIFQFIAPKALRKELFLHLHSSRIGGHLGISKTVENVRRRFYWPGCKTDIRR